MATMKVMGPAPHFRALLGNGLWVHLDAGGVVLTSETGGTLDAAGVVTAQLRLGPDQYHELEGYVEFLGCLSAALQVSSLSGVADLTVDDVIEGLFTGLEPVKGTH